MTIPKLAYLCVSESWGGLEMNQLRNAHWMKERGHNVLLIVLKNTPIAAEAEQFGLSIITISNYRKYYPLKRAFQLSKTFKKEVVSHLILRDPKDLSLGALIKTFLKNELHLSYFMEMQLGIDKKDLVHTIRFSKLDVWSCPLPWLAKQVQTRTLFPKDRIHVIPSGLDLEPFNSLPSQHDSRELLQLPNGKIIFGLIGRFDRQKGQLLLLEAYQKLAQVDQEKSVLLLLGEKTKNEADDYFDELQGFIANYRLENNVFIRPFRQDILPFYSAIDWLVMASKSETFGMVTIEALASGKPVIGSNAGGTPEILKNGEIGLLFKPENSDSLAHQLQKAIATKSISGLNQKSTAQLYSHNSVCERVEKALKLVKIERCDK